MKDIATHFPPSVADAHARLAGFAPQAGFDYAMGRNHDPGPDATGAVSRLSPYLRMKVLDEGMVSRAVLAQMGAHQAEKFLAEVWWRTYWKGWMEQRTAVWTAYREDLARLHNEVQTQSGLRARWEAACLGDTGIAPLDAWAQELARTGYLHNHARMWFASIWIFTLKLPWQLGADFFLRHLLDGDAAVNTLSWRWVAGIQTQGKTYLADPANIAKFTGGRFADLAGLATQAPAVSAPPPPAAAPIAELPDCEIAPSERVGVLLHADDIGAPDLAPWGVTPVATAYHDATTAQSPWQMAPQVVDFREALLRDLWPQAKVLPDAEAVEQWAREQRLDRIVTPHAPVGSTRAALRRIRKQGSTPLCEIRREIDSAAWPLATAGFFKFRAHIPALLDRFAR